MRPSFFAFLLIMLAGSPFALPPALGCVEKGVQTFSGKGAHTTRPFAVKEGWEIQWEGKGNFLSIYVHTKDGNLIDLAANQQGVGKGSAYQPQGGTYFLKINGLGEWTIKVVQLQ